MIVNGLNPEAYLREVSRATAVLTNCTGGGIPFSITGTTSNPSFLPDVAGMAGNVAQGALGNALSGKMGATKGAAGATGALGGLLGRKKPN